MVLLYIAAAVVLLALRFAQVRRVRYERRDALLKQYAHLVNNLDKMTYKDAEVIVRVSQHYDLPFITAISLSFALFKTYAVPTISAVLCKSAQLAAAENVARRAEDTSIVIGAFVNGGLDSEQGSTALARMNFLHARYGKLITREDKLYTLSTFVYEPALFAERFDWRPLTPLEKQARYVLWREIGARMGIDNIPATREALWEWKTAYENEHFVYADTNKKVGDSTMGLFVRQMPSFMQPFAASAAGVFLDDKTREAFGMPRPSLFLRIAVPALTKLKGIVGHFQMPRTEPPIYAQDEVFVDDKGHQRIRRGGYLWEPWYVSPTTGTKYGLFAYNPPGEQWHPEGYRPATLGPERLMDTGVEEVTKAASEMREQARGYPFFH